MFDVAACIVTYRSPVEEVKRAVDSFLDTRLNVHISIVDNASGDQYVEALKSVLNIQKTTFLSAPANRGFGAGHNLAMLQAPPCRYYLILNPDVVIHPGTLEALVRYMDEHPDVGVVAPKVLYEDGVLQPLNKREPTVLDLFLRRFCPRFLQRHPAIRSRMERYAMLDEGYDHVCAVPFLSGCFMLFRTSALERVGGFDERFFMYLEDADITKRTAMFAKAVYVPDATITHLWKRGSHHDLKLMLTMIHSMFVYFNKWGWKLW